MVNCECRSSDLRHVAKLKVSKKETYGQARAHRTLGYCAEVRQAEYRQCYFEKEMFKHKVLFIGSRQAQRSVALSSGFHSLVWVVGKSFLQQYVT